MFEALWLIAAIVVLVGLLALLGGLVVARRRGWAARRWLRSVRSGGGSNGPGSRAWIVAEPNPVPEGRNMGSTRISWSTGDGSAGEVWVAQGASDEAIFSALPEGSQVADWIQDGTEYHFRLYRGTHRKALLAQVTVRRGQPVAVPAIPSLAPSNGRADYARVGSEAAARITAQAVAFEPLPFLSVQEEVPPVGEHPGLYTIRWSSGVGTPAQVRVAVQGGAASPIVEGAFGHFQVDWIQPDLRYDFQLVAGSGTGQILATTVLQRTRPWVRVAGAPGASSRRHRGAKQVTWSSGNGAPAQLYRADPDGRERLVAEGAEGSLVIHQNGAAGPSELRLYAGRDGHRLLARTPLETQRGRPGRPFIEAVPNPVPAGENLGKTVITWSTGDGSLGQVFLVADRGEEIPFAQGAEGTQEITWIASDVAYRFRLYAGEDRSKVLASVTVTRGNQWREILLDLAVLGAIGTPVLVCGAAAAWLVRWTAQTAHRISLRMFRR